MRAALLTIAVALLISSVAHADPAGAPADPPKTEYHWWGGMPLLVDAASAALIVGSVGVKPHSLAASKAMLLAGVGGYLLGTPLVQAHLGHRVHAIVSIGARVIVPLVAGYALSKYDETRYTGEDAGLGGLIYGALGGAALTALLDDAFSWKAVPYAAPAPSGGGATVGVAGAF